MSKIKREIVEELRRKARVHFPRRRIITKGIDDLFQADLVEMIPYARINKGYRYILVVIDVFSKYLWTKPVKNKSGSEISTAMKSIFLSSNRIPRNLQTDLGKEFYNQNFQNLMNKYNINHYSTYSTMKASIVERGNRTLKSMMWKEFSLQGTYKWLRLLPQLTEKYNNTKHRTINMRPTDVSKKNEKFLLNSVYSQIKMVGKVKFKVGDFVRISKHRGAFVKGYTPNWSNEIFSIHLIQFTNPVTYILKDQSGQIIKGGFYEYELQKVKYPDVYLVEKILKKKNNMIFVKWLGFDNKHNSWINKSNVE